MQNKFFVIDGRFVWTGSTNLSDYGFTLNHNNTLLLDCERFREIPTMSRPRLIPR